MFSDNYSFSGYSVSWISGKLSVFVCNRDVFLNIMFVVPFKCSIKNTFILIT